MNHEVFNRNQCDINNNFNYDSVINSNNRKFDCGFDSLKEATNLYTDNERYHESLDSRINVKIYRYKFSDEFIDELYNFSKIHQYDHRKDFKEAWELWIEDNSSLILQESTRLIDIGYEGDILNKMFISARYYFRKKGTEKKEPRMRCTYVGIHKELLDAMDNHISMNLNQSWYKPSSGFKDFCKENMDLLQQEVDLLVKYKIIDPNEIKNKIKKTYKNRYFIIINKKV